MWLVDADDFCIGNTGLNLLTEIRHKIPNFKITMFTIIGKCTSNFIKYCQDNFPWMDLVPHGMFHTTPYECATWDYEYCLDYLNYIEQFNLTKGFKAPGWQVSDGCYKALLEKDYWIADQKYNTHRRPPGLKVYELQPNSAHYHVQNVCGNGLEESLPHILNLSGDFMFIKDFMEEKHGTSGTETVC